MGFPGGASVLRICLQCRRPGFDPWVGKIPRRREKQHIPLFLPGESHGQRSLADYSPCGGKELNITERLTLTFLHVYIYPLLLESPSNPNPHSILLDHLCGEGNSNPLHFSCLENSMDRGVWWAAVLGVAQSRTWLKRLSMHACIGEGNGNPLQCSCLENPRDGGAWWAAISGVAQRQTQPKQLSSSSSRSSLS